MQIEQLTELGWWVLPIRPRDKNPGTLLGSGWHKQASNSLEVIEFWQEQYPDCNWGVLLGPKSGIIDVEYDSESGKEILNKLFEGVQTPCYTSGKSLHRLFKWDKRFEGQKASSGYDGTEWRFGNDSAQSVIPPSLHPGGSRYKWIISPDECEIAELPEHAWQSFLINAKAIPRPATQIEVASIPDEFDDSLISRARRHCAQYYNWEELLPQYGWKKARVRGEAIDWTRPGKKDGVSATTNYDGSGTLAVFTSNAPPLEQYCSYDKFAFLCVMEYGDDPFRAAESLAPTESDPYAGIDISGILLGKERAIDADDNEFCEEMCPQEGLIRDVYDYYVKSAYRQCPVFAMATAISFCQTIFGRKIASYTDLRSNDYHLILAGTGYGKEGPLQVMYRLFRAASCTEYIMPEKIQSGSALMRRMADAPTQLWCCDEFGYMLAAMLDKKSRDPHAKAIGELLLKLYSKSNSYMTGSAYANGITHEVNQPHLCVLGVSTGVTVFSEISQVQILDGMMGRISFWSVQDKPKPNRNLDTTVPDLLIERIREWHEFQPGGGNLSGVFNEPIRFAFTEEAKKRWEDHEDRVDSHGRSERAVRQALWVRTPARAMKLAITHRAARLNPAEVNEFNQPMVELEDVNWGIKVANWNTRLACSLMAEQVKDNIGEQLRNKIKQFVQSAKTGVTKTEITRAFRSADTGQISAAIEELVQCASVREEVIDTKGRPKTFYHPA